MTFGMQHANHWPMVPYPPSSMYSPDGYSGAYEHSDDPIAPALSTNRITSKAASKIEVPTKTLGTPYTQYPLPRGEEAAGFAYKVNSRMCTFSGKGDSMQGLEAC